MPTCFLCAAACISRAVAAPASVAGVRQCAVQLRGALSEYWQHPDALVPTTTRQGVLDFKGGEAAALARLNYYLFESNLIATYFDTRNGMLGGLKLGPSCRTKLAGRFERALLPWHDTLWEGG